MGNCLKIQKEKEHLISGLEFEQSISQSHFSITSEVERYMYVTHICINNLSPNLNYDEFKELITFE